MEILTIKAHCSKYIVLENRSLAVNGKSKQLQVAYIKLKQQHNEPTCDKLEGHMEKGCRDRKKMPQHL